MSYTFVIDNEKSSKDSKYRINTRFNPTLELNKTKNYEMALVNLETVWSFPNVTEKNNLFKFSKGSVVHRILIEKGAYELSAINRYIHGNHYHC